MSSPFFNMCLSEIRRAEETKDWIGVRHLLLNIWRWNIPDEELEDLFGRCSSVDMSFTDVEFATYDPVVSYDMEAISNFLGRMSGKSWWHTLLDIQCHSFPERSFRMRYLPFKLLFYTDLKSVRIALENKQLDNFIDNLEHLHHLREYFCRIYIQGQEDDAEGEMQKLIAQRKFPDSKALMDKRSRDSQNAMLQMITEIYPQFCQRWRGDLLGSPTFEQCKKLWEDYDR